MNAKNKETIKMYNRIYEVGFDYIEKKHLRPYVIDFTFNDTPNYSGIYIPNKRIININVPYFIRIMEFDNSINLIDNVISDPHRDLLFTLYHELDHVEQFQLISEYPNRPKAKIIERSLSLDTSNKYNIPSIHDLYCHEHMADVGAAISLCQLLQEDELVQKKYNKYKFMVKDYSFHSGKLLSPYEKCCLNGIIGPRRRKVFDTLSQELSVEDKLLLGLNVDVADYYKYKTNADSIKNGTSVSI